MKKLLALIALLIFAPAFAADCNDNGNRPGTFPLADQSKLAALIIAVQKSVAGNDKNAFADHVEFPLSANDAGKQHELDRTQFLAQYDAIVTPKVRSAIAGASFRSTSEHACMFWNSRGVMLGDGEVWINDDAQGEPRIVSINSGG